MILLYMSFSTILALILNILHTSRHFYRVVEQAIEHVAHVEYLANFLAFYRVVEQAIEQGTLSV